MKFDMNHEVKVKLTDIGRKEHKLRWARMKSPYEYRPPKEDDEGWSIWQLYVFMEEFGGVRRTNFALPFETVIEIIERP